MFVLQDQGRVRQDWSEIWVGSGP